MKSAVEIFFDFFSMKSAVEICFDFFSMKSSVENFFDFFSMKSAVENFFKNNGKSLPKNPSKIGEMTHFLVLKSYKMA